MRRLHSAFVMEISNGELPASRNRQGHLFRLPLSRRNQRHLHQIRMKDPEFILFRPRTRSHQQRQIIPHLASEPLHLAISTKFILPPAPRRTISLETASLRLPQRPRHLWRQLPQKRRSLRRRLSGKNQRHKRYGLRRCTNLQVRGKAIWHLGRGIGSE